MSTDRELLELAAKAAGLNVVWYGAHFGEGFRIKGEQDGYRHGQPWNPLTDDGDALRLAVAISMGAGDGIRVMPPDRFDPWAVVNDFNDSIKDGRSADADPFAATRRAIVLAAAQIGKTNQPGEAG